MTPTLGARHMGLLFAMMAVLAAVVAVLYRPNSAATRCGPKALHPGRSHSMGVGPSQCICETDTGKFSVCCIADSRAEISQDSPLSSTKVN